MIEATYFSSFNCTVAVRAVALRGSSVSRAGDHEHSAHHNEASYPSKNHCTKHRFSHPRPCILPGKIDLSGVKRCFWAVSVELDDEGGESRTRIFLPQRGPHQPREPCPRLAPAPSRRHYIAKDADAWCVKCANLQHMCLIKSTNA